jgi:hypothetical protein
MKTIKLIILTSASLLTGCFNDKNDSFETPISGYYKITSFESTTEVDMNNDGIRSKDLYEEVSSLHKTPDNQQVSLYDFQSRPNYMEVRPLVDQTNNAKLISLNVPEQRIDDLTSGQLYPGDYLHSFINYSYELNDRSNKIELINNNKEYLEMGALNNFELQKNGSLKLEMTKELFAFVGSKWIQAEVTIIYQKAD